LATANRGRVATPVPKGGIATRSARLSADDGCNTTTIFFLFKIFNIYFDKKLALHLFIFSPNIFTTETQKNK
jgi:hypothetical protein